MAERNIPNAVTGIKEDKQYTPTGCVYISFTIQN